LENFESIFGIKDPKLAKQGKRKKKIIKIKLTNYKVEAIIFTFYPLVGGIRRLVYLGRPRPAKVN